HTLGKTFRTSNYHFNVVRSTLTRNLGVRFSDVRDEIMTAFSDEIPVSEDWITLPALDTIMKVVCRTTNRLFVGLPMCREPDWIDLNIQFTVQVFGRAPIINLFPGFLQPIVGSLLSPRANALKRARRHIGNVVRERVEKDDQYGRGWADKPVRKNE
ncbi:hypothetical protein K435DRAFT_703395, partial [Dendrothele bispora CBS 962.96]